MLNLIPIFAPEIEIPRENGQNRLRESNLSTEILIFRSGPLGCHQRRFSPRNTYFEIVSNLFVLKVVSIILKAIFGFDSFHTLSLPL